MSVLDNCEILLRTMPRIIRRNLGRTSRCRYRRSSRSVNVQIVLPWARLCKGPLRYPARHTSIFYIAAGKIRPHSGPLGYKCSSISPPRIFISSSRSSSCWVIPDLIHRGDIPVNFFRPSGCRSAEQARFTVLSIYFVTFPFPFPRVQGLRNFFS